MCIRDSLSPFCFLTLLHLVFLGVIFLLQNNAFDISQEFWVFKEKIFLNVDRNAGQKVLQTHRKMIQMQQFLPVIISTIII